jgi:hypothetical protein
MSVLNWLAGALALCALGARADERVTVCFNYGCLTQAEVVYSDAQLRDLGLGGAADAVEERQQIAAAVGRLLGWAGGQSPIFADRGGNFADQGVYGRMDCIDHSTTTTRLLRMVERRGLLHYHRVLDPELRRRFLIFDHFSATIEEIDAVRAAVPTDGPPSGPTSGAQFAVDSWFFDNGQPAAVMPLAQWRSGESPNGYE